MSKRLVSLVLGGLAIGGCDRVTDLCTQVGCGDALTLHLIDANDQPVTGAAGTVTVGLTTWTVDCLGTSDAEVHCDGGTIVIRDVGPSDEVAVDLRGTSGSITATVPVEWQQLAPNGVECGPVCHVATLALLVASET